MRKILVTGATGFIGNYVIEELLRHQVSVIATSSNIEKAKTFAWFNKVQYIEFDFKSFDNKNNYFQFFNNPDILIHLAWEGLPNYKNDFHLTENLPRHQYFLENIVTNGLKNISITGTCFEYGMQEGELKETLQCYPGNAYAIAKNQLRIFSEDLAVKFSLKLKWIRLFYMFGKGQNPNSLTSQLDKAIEANIEVFNMSGGEQIRDFLPVEKVAENIVIIALQNNINGIINCCSGIPITVKAFVDNYLQVHNKKIQLNLGYYPYPDFEPMYFWGNNEKLKTIINGQNSGV
jgi:nucleoside-diphosphate-sugar epimerase